MTKYLIRFFLVLACAVLPCAAQAQAVSTPAPTAEIAAVSATDLQTILQANRAAIEKASRSTVDTVLKALLDSGLDGASTFIERWRDRAVVQRKADGVFFYAAESGTQYILTDIATGADAGTAPKTDMEALRPNSGVRAVLSAALVQFQLADPDPAKRAAALQAIERDANQTHLAPLRAAIDNETDATLKARKVRLERLLTIAYEADKAARIAAINSFAGETDVDVRAALSRMLVTTTAFARQSPANTNIARVLTPGEDISVDVAYALLVTAGEAAPAPDAASIRAALIANREDNSVAGMPVASFNTEQARLAAYQALAAAGTVPPLVLEADKRAILAEFQFFDAYAEADSEVTSAAEGALAAINRQVGISRFADLLLDALSLASIYFLAAIGLAITFGVMRVINMAHGEFIMIGAYTGYVVQQYIADYTISILVACRWPSSLQPPP
ncbi:MAG: urea ABC transporter permease subunit UrtB, partial [Phyllobacteriaceae bacterium]|nr:urea ABC transporter permease subunit UrtB [Phyllobacteriaceae bacterium]